MLSVTRLLATLLLAGFAAPVFAQSPHRIGVRAVGAEGEFYDTVTGERFTPHGVNYLDFVSLPGGGVEDRVLATNVFNPERIRTEFARLSGLGYNTVRIFFDHCGTYGPECLTVRGRPGLNPAYLDNLAELTRIAAETGIYLQLTSNDIPDEGGYGKLANRDSGPMMAGYRNTHFIAPSGLEAATAYWTDLMDGLADRETAWSAVLGWQLINEQWIFKAQPPWSLNAGVIVNNTGQSYDLSDPDQKRAMVSDAVVNMAQTLRRIVRQHDPQALVTMGFFAPQFPNPTSIGGDWWVDTEPVLEAHPLDYYDFHAYFDTDLTAAGHAENFGMTRHPGRVVVMGEVGGGKARIQSAATSLRLAQEWYAESCAAGFDGWLYWLYFDTQIEDPPWAFLDDDGLIMSGLAPANRPDPCDAEAFSPVGNVAFHARARASSSLPEEPASQAVDGLQSAWSSGADAPGWIAVDLDAPVTLRSINLWVGQWPPGETRHRVTAERADGSRVLIAVFDGFTRPDQTLSATLPAPLDEVVGVRIDTPESVSWVAWQEIELIATTEPAGACIVAATAGVNLRPDPSTVHAPIGRLSPGEAVLARAVQRDADGHSWLKLVSDAWVRGDVVETGGECGALPTDATNP